MFSSENTIIVTAENILATFNLQVIKIFPTFQVNWPISS